MKAEWALWKGNRRWIVAIKMPIPPQEMLELVRTFHIERAQTLPSGNLALYILATPKNVAKLMEQPKPKWGGSRHECNLTSW